MAKRPLHNRPIKFDEAANTVVLAGRAYSLSDFQEYLTQKWNNITLQYFKSWEKVPGGLKAIYDWKAVFAEVNKTMLPALIFIEQTVKTEMDGPKTEPNPQPADH